MTPEVKYGCQFGWHVMHHEPCLDFMDLDDDDHPAESSAAKQR